MKITQLGKIGIIGLALYGAVNIANQFYRTIKPESAETYRLALMYCDPERSLCKNPTVPGLINLIDKDNRLLWGASIETYIQSNILYVKKVWSDPKLSEKISLEFDIIGRPK